MRGADTVTGFVARALAWYAAHGITASRVMSDNAWAYTTNRSLGQRLTSHQIPHLRTPQRPQVKR